MHARNNSLTRCLYNFEFTLFQPYNCQFKHNRQIKRDEQTSNCVVFTVKFDSDILMKVWFIFVYLKCQLVMENSNAIK